MEIPCLNGIRLKIRFKGGVNRLGKGTARKARKALY